MFLPLFVETKSRVAKRNTAHAPPWSILPLNGVPIWETWILRPKKKWLVGDIYSQACSYHTHCNHIENTTMINQQCTKVSRKKFHSK